VSDVVDGSRAVVWGVGGCVRESGCVRGGVSKKTDRASVLYPLVLRAHVYVAVVRPARLLPVTLTSPKTVCRASCVRCRAQTCHGRAAQALHVARCLLAGRAAAC
jgi:hypothetical protein